MYMLEHDVINLWPMPLYRARVQIDTGLLDQLCDEGQSWYEDGLDSSLGPKSHSESSDRHLLDREEFHALRDQIQAHVDCFVYQRLHLVPEIKWQLTTSWVNRAEPGNYHQQHWHSNSLLSGVVYLKTTPKTGHILFHKDKGYPNLFTDTLRIDWTQQSDWTIETVGLTPAPGDLLMFPSTLLHSVTENLDSEPRYSLAFNVFPRGQIAPGSNSELGL